MKTAPNALTDEGYTTAGGSLKIRYPVKRGNAGWLEFSPALLQVEFNGHPIEFCQGISLTIDREGVPTCKLEFTLDDIDIDMDALMWFKAHMEAKDNG